MKLQALGEKILVLEDKPQRATVSGFILPMHWQKPATGGWIESIGPQAARKFPDLRVKMPVLFRPFTGTNLIFQGRHFRLLDWHELVGVIDRVDLASPKT